MIFTVIVKRFAMIFPAIIAYLKKVVLEAILYVKGGRNVTHNQVSYWNMITDRKIREEQNRIQAINAEAAKWNAHTNRYAAEQEAYWTHKQFNKEDEKFGYTMFKDLVSTMVGFGAFI